MSGIQKLCKTQGYLTCIGNNWNILVIKHQTVAGTYMNIENLSIDSVYQDPNNVRIHDDKNIEAIKGSLKKFGQQKPIVIDEKNIILAGNGTHLAAIALGWKQISVVRSNLKNFDKMAFALADNRSAELASWDMGKLSEQLQIIEEPELIGFDDDFIQLDDDKPSTDIKSIDGATELNEDNFDNFDNQCPKCGFEWDKKQ